MAKITFSIKSKNNPAGIYVRLIDGKSIDVMAKTNKSIDPNDWSPKKQQPKNLKDDYFKNFNSDLIELKSNLLKHYNNCKDRAEINTAWLKNFINPPETITGYPSSLVEYFDIYKEGRKSLVSPNSIKKYNVIKNKLIKFQNEHKTIIQVKDVNRDFQKKFEAFCIKHNYAHNTITMELRFIKTVCRHAISNGVEGHPHLEKIENKYEPVDTIFLTEADLAKVKKVKLIESLDNVRDWLLISCYCGQRVSDFLRFNKSMIREQKNREGKIVSLIEFEQTKTGKIMTLPLHSEIVRILGKRQGEFPPSISDQKYNQYVKVVCQKAGLTYKVTGSKKTETEKDSGIFRKETGEFEKWELVSSHIGRRSFATNFYGKIPTSLLIAATGHSTEAQLYSYLRKSPADRAIELAEYF